jgi:uncharacterized protein (DUF302 family)
MTHELGIQTRLRLPFSEAYTRAVEALKVEGFGVLTEIDVQATMKQKLNVDFQRYVILGACNPPLAHRAFLGTLDVGLLLPCNVTVYEDGDEVVVNAINPGMMLSVIPDNSVLAEVAKEARERLERVIQSLKS